MTNKISNKTELLSVGLMSGTSMDGIDAALLLTDGDDSIKRLGHYSLEYDPVLKVLLKVCERAARINKGDLKKSADSFKGILSNYIAEQKAQSSFPNIS